MYLKINYFSAFLKLLSKQAICSIGCVFFLMIFPAMIDFGFAEILYTIFAFIIFFDMLYTVSWNIGDKHRRDVNIHNRKLSEDGSNTDEMKYKYSIGIKLGIIYTLFNLIIFALCYLLTLFGIPELSVTGNIVYKIWFIEFCVLFNYIVRLQHLLWFILAFVPILPIILGFISGVKGANNFDDFVKKLVYKSK